MNWENSSEKNVSLIKMKNRKSGRTVAEKAYKCLFNVETFKIIEWEILNKRLNLFDVN
ncbi:hypothetical protein KZO01_16560 [Kurthia zopfii]|nr:hypothetical protein KZO01_16560 [Kurthia zopfii]